MNANTPSKPSATVIDLSNVLIVRFDMEPNWAYVRVPGKFYRLTMSEFRTLINDGSVSI